MALTEKPYNVLRILRGAGPEGLACSEIAARMITRDPDITPLPDRLERDGFITRMREASDPRVIATHIAEQGLDTLSAWINRSSNCSKRGWGASVRLTCAA
jgi:DNA-binding MarR family transcriptional regulator